MISISSSTVFGLICALAGLVHTLAPDHWVPSSILGWKRGWRIGKIALFSFFAFLGHVLLGFVIFWLSLRILARMPSSSFLFFSLFLVGVVALIRGLRFGRIEEVLRAGTSGSWGLVTVLSLLGPCESIIPILIKSRLIGMGYLMPFSAFLVGSLVGGIILIHSGRWVWNKPLLFPRSIHWLKGQVTTVPLVLGVVIGLSLLVRIS